MRPYVKTILCLVAFFTGVAQAAVVGEVIAAHELFAGKYAVMSAANGSQFAMLDCGGDLTHTGSPRYFVRSLSGAVVLPDGYLNNNIVAADEDCAQTMILTDRSDMRFSTVPHWSPDGTRIAVYGARFEPSNPSPVESGIYLMDVVRTTGGRPVGTANLRLVVPLEGEVSIGWSGEGGRLVYAQGVPNAQGKLFLDVFVHDIASGVSLNVTNTPDESEASPVFSPADNRIAFEKLVAVRGSSRHDIFTMDAAGGPLTQVTSKKTTGAPANVVPEFSPDGQYLLFSSGTLPGFFQDFDLYKIKADGSGKAVNLTAKHDGSYRGVNFWRR